MSSRALRRLQGEPSFPVEKSESDSDCNESTSVRNKGTLNPFDLLEDEDVQNDEDDNDQAESIKVESQPERGKKKKKKKKKPSTNCDEELDIDEIIAQNRACGAQLNENSSSMETNLASIFKVEAKNLNSETEMKKIFGSRVVQRESNRRNLRNRPYQKNTKLVQRRDNWPAIARTGLTMELLESRDGCSYFSYRHSKEYRTVQFGFLDAVESIDPQNIVELARANPYHVDASLQLSEISRMSEDPQMAAELVERALYSLEYAAHSSFSFTTGCCRLDYRRPENRSLFLALFRHLTYVGNRGCPRTALELCKLLFTLAPEDDPLCVLLLIDFYALRAGQNEYLVQLFHELEASRQLSQLPNFAFSVPLAMFNHSVANNVATGAADHILQASLLMFPGLLIPLMDKCGVAVDADVEKHRFFAQQPNQPEALKLLFGLYVGRCFALWKEPEALAWLERNVRDVIARVDGHDPLVDEFEKKRNSRYSGTPLNVLRHAVISEVKEATAALPPEVARTGVLSHDPLPPPDSIVSYERPPRPRRAQRTHSALGAFIASLLPGYNPQELVAEEEAAGAAGGGGELHTGIGALMEAMRELLNNIQPQADDEAERDPDEPGPGEWD